MRPAVARARSKWCWSSLERDDASVVIIDAEGLITVREAFGSGNRCCKCQLWVQELARRGNNHHDDITEVKLT